MKSLKITLVLAVFCLTISGTTKNTEKEPTNVTFEKVDKKEFKFIADLKKGTKKPNQI